ncbi:unnamed protein product [Moneuplotes crassus]|uniref:Uncharacterized protein n=2 Tax=Euplotes crassus TaxID=5936 RepID=A0AAD2D9L0_EUPCR|nr:unnamed protein product [Moneuplotes crassus]
MESDLHDQLFLNCDKNNWIFSGPLDDEWVVQSQTKINAISVLNEFLKIKLLLKEELSQISSQYSEKCLQRTTQNYKYALINEAGLRLVGWIENFQEFNPNEADPFDVNLSLEEPEAFASRGVHSIVYKEQDEELDSQSILETVLTPFERFENQPSFIKEFTSLLTKEFNTLGNIFSYCLKQEVSSQNEKDMKKLTSMFKEEVSLLMPHLKQMMELIINQFLISIKDKILDGTLDFFHFQSIYDNILHPKIEKISKNFQAKIARGAYWKQPITSDALLDKCKGFTLENCSTKSKLVFSECCRGLLGSKNIIFEKIIKESFDSLLSEIRKSHAEGVPKARSQDLMMVEVNPLTSIRPYMFDILETICSFLIKIFDGSGSQSKGLFFPKKLFSIQSDLLTQYEFELTPEILKQIYFEYQFLFEIANAYLCAYTQIDQKANELTQKLLQMIMKSSARMQQRKTFQSQQLDESDVFSEEEITKLNKSLRSLKLIHEYNFCVLNMVGVAT